MLPTVEKSPQELAYSLPEDLLPAISRDRARGTLCCLQHLGSVRQTVFFLTLNPEIIGCSKSSTELLNNVFEIICVESIAFQGSYFD